MNFTFLRTHVKPYIKDLEIIAELHTVKGGVYRLRERRRVASGQVFGKFNCIERMEEVWGVPALHMCAELCSTRLYPHSS